MIIYKITNKINKKIYIGQTTQSLRKRWYGHIFTSKHDKYHMAIARAIRKYGKENFEMEQIDEASSLEELNIKEFFFINMLNLRRWVLNDINNNKITLIEGEIKKFCREQKIWSIYLFQVLSGKRKEYKGFTLIGEEKIDISSLPIETIL